MDEAMSIQVRSSDDADGARRQDRGQPREVIDLTSDGDDDMPHSRETIDLTSDCEDDVPHGMKQGEGCYLLRLNSEMIGVVWPAERVMTGLRVCTRVRKDLTRHADAVTLSKMPGASLRKHIFATDFWRRMRKVALTFQGLPDQLVLLEPLSTALTHLHVKVCLLRGSEVQGLARVLRMCKVLQHLDLSNAGIGERGMEILERQCSALAHLRLSHLNLSENSIGSGGARWLAVVLGNCNALTHLDLSCNRFGDEGIRMLAGGGLEQCTALVLLDLSDNCVGDDGVPALVGALGGCKALAHLDLRKSIIGNKGAKSLARAVGGFTALRRLDLKYNWIEAAGARSLVEAQAQCVGLQLDLAQQLEEEWLEPVFRIDPEQVRRLVRAASELRNDDADELGDADAGLLINTNLDLEDVLW